MVFTKEDEVLIKVLRQSKGYNARKLLEKFPGKDYSLVQHWTDFCGRLTLQGLQTGSPEENVQSAQETCKCLCKWRPL